MADKNTEFLIFHTKENWVSKMEDLYFIKNILFATKISLLMVNVNLMAMGELMN